MTLDEVIAGLTRELQSLQPAIAALDDIPALEQAVREAWAEHRAWYESSKRPIYSSEPDHTAIELDGIATRARQRVDAVRRDGNAAQRRANEIRSLLDAPSDIERARSERKGLLEAQTETRAALAKATSLVESIRIEIAQINKRRNALINQGVEERLAGKPETTAKELAQIEAKLTIEKRALEGAEPKQAELSKAVEEFPERIRLAEVAMRHARSRLAALHWLPDQATAEDLAARYIASRRLMGYFDEEVKVRPSRALIDAAVRELEAELQGEDG